MPSPPPRSDAAKRSRQEELEAAIAAAVAESDCPPFCSTAQFAKLLGRSLKTIYEWRADGRLDGALRKRGKHLLILRDLALRAVFFGPEWSTK